MCMSDEETGTRQPFSFLDALKSRWFSAYGNRGATALAYGMNEDFCNVISRQMEQHSYQAASEVDTISRVRVEIDEVKSVMVQNIERVLERGERIELLVDKTDNLNTTAFAFRKQSVSLRRALWWKNAKLVLALAGIVVAIALVIVMSACGLTFSKCMSHKSTAPP
mmetsp:Transcript_17517/g.40674  ORF Transcript_17517/g.40674 Transcript_17517/m.40674 type:complete len:166 (-) Transcript_17517:199-696(-)